MRPHWLSVLYAVLLLRLNRVAALTWWPEFGVQTVVVRNSRGAAVVTLVRRNLSQETVRSGSRQPQLLTKDVSIGLLLPAEDQYESGVLKVLPAVVMALRTVSSPGQLLEGWSFTLHVRDTRCSGIYAPAHAVQSYIHDDVGLFLGPVCDFSLAPVARLVKFWNVPLVTAGGLSYDFSLPKTDPQAEYYMTTRTGFGFPGIVETICHVLRNFSWRKVMLIYEKDAYRTISGGQTCYLAMSTLVKSLKEQNVSYGTYDMGKHRHFTLSENLRSEVGLQYAGQFTSSASKAADHRYPRELIIGIKGS